LDFQLSRGPKAIGICANSVDECAAAVNAAQERILYAPEQSEMGAWGAWAEMLFTLSRTDPFITPPRGVARVISFNGCTYPIPMQNQFYEYLQFGFGRYPKTTCTGLNCVPFQGYSRGIVPTMTDFTAGKKIRVYPSNTADSTLRTLITGTDTNDQPVFNLDGTVQVQGEMVNLITPFTDTTIAWNSIAAIQKDITLGPVSYYQVDPITASQSLLLTMEPTETTATYQRYYFSGVPQNCCNTTDPADTTVQATAIVKLDLIPVRAATDYLLIQNIEALIAECQSVRYSEMDSPQAMVKSQERHRAAIRLLNGELIHYSGKEPVAVDFAPFGSAHLSCQRIGRLM